jgi:starch synthase
MKKLFIPAFFRIFARLFSNSNMKAKKILFISQEMVPYVTGSSLAESGRNLPQSIQEMGSEIRSFMPKWGVINERRNQLHEVIRLSGMNIIIDDTDHPLIIKVASIQAARMQVYFIDNDDYFMKRQMACDENGVEYDDNGERAIFYARGVLETVKKLRWTPDIIHCQGWVGSVVPLFIKTAYHDEPCFQNTKVVCSLFGTPLTKPVGENFTQLLECKSLTKDMLEGYNDPFMYDDLMHLAIDYSDGIVQAEANVPEAYMEYAKQKNVLTLPYVEGDDYKRVDAFYNQILGVTPEEEAE